MQYKSSSDCKDPFQRQSNLPHHNEIGRVKELVALSPQLRLQPRSPLRRRPSFFVRALPTDIYQSPLFFYLPSQFHLLNMSLAPRKRRTDRNESPSLPVRSYSDDDKVNLQLVPNYNDRD